MRTKKILTDIVNRKLVDLGINPPEVLKDPEDGRWTRIGTVHIIPKSLGLMAPVFKEIELEIKGAINAEKEEAYLSLHYHWKHPSGSNGYKVEFVYKNLVWDN